MTRQETGIIMDILTAAYPRFYAGVGQQDMRKSLNLWAEMFQRDDVVLVAAAVKSVIEGDEKGFPPTIGQVKAKMRLLTGSDEMSEAEAWELVSKAIRNGLYGAQEEFDKFPPVIRRIVGSPNTLREWARMDTETVHSVVSSNFQRSFRAISAKEQEYAKLPAEVKELVRSLKGVRPVELTASAPSPTLPEPKPTPAPAWFHETVKTPARSREEVMRYLRGEGVKQ